MKNRLSLSIIIPALNEYNNLTALAGHLAECLNDNMEVIVSDGGSADGSTSVAGQFADHCCVGRRGRGVQMNLGARRAQGEYLLFLHADTRLPKGFGGYFESWAQSCPDWGFFPLQLDAYGWPYRMIERSITLRSTLTSSPTGDQAIVVRRDLFEELGGFPEIELMEDVEFTRSLRRRARPKSFPVSVTTSSRRWQSKGVAKTIVLMWWLKILHRVGVPHSRLNRLYNG